MRRVILALLPLLLCSGWPVLSEPPMLLTPIVLTPTGPIPQGLETYTLFLFCDSVWTKKADHDSFIELYRDFKVFGSAIGPKNAAIWFWKQTDLQTKIDPHPVDLDVERTQRFCKAWKLSSHSGPHLVVTTGYPDENALQNIKPSDRSDTELGPKKLPELQDFFKQTTQSLLSLGSAKAVATLHSDEQPGSADPTWVRLCDALQAAILKLGCAAEVELGPEPFKIKIHTCKSEKSEGSNAD